MNIRSSLIKIFNLEKGEEKVVSLIVIYSFFIGAAIAFFVSSATSIFLNLFDKKMLPVSFIVSGIIVYFVGYVFSKLQEKIKFSNLLNLALSFLLISTGVLLVFYLIGNAAWIVFMLYVWIRIFSYIHAVTFWGLASKLFNLRQGKRIYGLIGTGEVVSSIISFFSIPILLQFITTEDLLYIAVLCLVISSLFMFIIVRTYKVNLSVIAKRKPVIKADSTENHKISFFENKYFSIIFFISLFPVLGQFLVDFIFQAQLKIQFPQKEALTGFIGIFFGFTCIVEFVLKTFLSGRLISRYGIKLGLILFPLMLVFSFLFASLTGTFAGTAAMFFPFVALGRLFSRAIRTSFNDPSTQLLFQPIPAEIRLAFQSKIEGGPKAFGNIIAGVLILLLSTLSFLELVHFSYILLAIVIFWTKLSFDAYKEYKKTIENVLNTDKLMTETQEYSTFSVLSDLNKFQTKEDLENLKKILSLFRKVEPHFIDSYLVKKFEKNNNFVNNCIIDELYNKSNFRELTSVFENLKEDHKIKFSEKISLFKPRMDYISNIDFEDVIKLANSEIISDRKEASLILRYLKRFNSYKYIFILMNDKVSEIKANAIIAAGENKNSELWQKLFENLRNDYFRSYAINSILNIGEPILTELEKYFDKNPGYIDLQIIIINIFGRINSKKAIKFLRNKINHQQKSIKYAAINALNKKEYVANRIETTHINYSIEKDVELIVWLCATIEDLRIQASQKLLNALIDEFEQVKENVFTLLSAVYLRKNIDVIKKNLASTTGDSKGYALEIFDMIFTEEIKNLLLPIFENTSNFDILAAYKYHYPQKKLSYYERLINIINKDYNDINVWIKSLALVELANNNSPENESIFISNLPNPNITIKEIAASNLYKIDDEKFLDQLVKLKFEDKINFKDLKTKIDKESGVNNLFIFEKVEILQNLIYFTDINSLYLNEIAEKSYDFFVEREQNINLQLNNNIFVVIKGQLKIKNSFEEFEFSVNQIIDFTSNYDNCEFEIIATEKTHLLSIDYDCIINVLLKKNELFEKYLQNIIKS